MYKVQPMILERERVGELYSRLEKWKSDYIRNKEVDIIDLPISIHFQLQSFEICRKQFRFLNRKLVIMKIFTRWVSLDLRVEEGLRMER